MQKTGKMFHCAFVCIRSLYCTNKDPHIFFFVCVTANVALTLSFSLLGLLRPVTDGLMCDCKKPKMHFVSRLPHYQ